MIAQRLLLLKLLLLLSLFTTKYATLNFLDSKDILIKMLPLSQSVPVEPAPGLRYPCCCSESLRVVLFALSLWDEP